MKTPQTVEQRLKNTEMIAWTGLVLAAIVGLSLAFSIGMLDKILELGVRTLTTTQGTK